MSRVECTQKAETVHKVINDCPLPLRLAKDLDFVIRFPPTSVVPRRKEFRWVKDRRDPIGLDPEEGVPPEAPLLNRLDMATLRYDISVAMSARK